MSEAAKSERYVFLDGLRGLAALSVAAAHSASISGRGIRFFDNAGLAVDFFFCLSGFVVAHAYDARLAKGMPVVRQFMARRMIRLYPMILLGAILGGIAHITVTSDGLASTAWRSLLTAAMIPNLKGGLAYPLNGPMWSLFFEIMACLGYGLAVRILPRRALLWILVLSGAVLAAAVLYAGQIVTFGVAGLIGFANGALRVCFPFLLGVLLQRSRVTDRLPRFHPAIGASLLLFILFVPTSARAIYQAVAAMALLPAVLIIGASTTIRRPWGWELLGRLSYPLYIVHWAVLLVVDHFVHLRLRGPFSEILGVSVALGVAWIALIIYDEPVRALLGRALRRTQGGQTDPGARPESVRAGSEAA